MWAQIYEILGLSFLLGSAYFFYRAVEFLAQPDYVAGLMTLLIAFLVVRAGVDISRLGLARANDGE